LFFIKNLRRPGNFALQIPDRAAECRIVRRHLPGGEDPRIDRFGRTALTDKPKMTPAEARRDHEEMLRFMAKRFAIGAGIGLICATLIFLLDIGGLGSRLARASDPIIPVFLIAVPMGLTFGAVMVCIAIWVLPYENKYAEDYKGPDPF
jgi:hypothetical protein